MSLTAAGHLSADAKPNSVYRYFDHLGRLIYIGITARGIQRQNEHEKLSDWFPYAETQRLETCHDRDAALTLERELIKAFRPPFNKIHNGDWEPLRAAYLAVRAAEERLVAAQKGEVAPKRCAQKAYPCLGEPGCEVGPYFWQVEEACGSPSCEECHAETHAYGRGYEDGSDVGASQLADHLYFTLKVGSPALVAATQSLLHSAEAYALIDQTERGSWADVRKYFTDVSTDGRLAGDQCAADNEARANELATETGTRSDGDPWATAGESNG